MQTFRFRRLLLRGRQRDPMTKMTERPIATGKQDHLHPRRSLRQDLGHEVEPGVVRIDEWIVEDARYRNALFQKHVGKRQAGEDRQLLLSAPGRGRRIPRSGRGG